MQLERLLKSLYSSDILASDGKLCDPSWTSALQATWARNWKPTILEYQVRTHWFALSLDVSMVKAAIQDEEAL